MRLNALDIVQTVCVHWSAYAFEKNREKYVIYSFKNPHIHDTSGFSYFIYFSFTKQFIFHVIFFFTISEDLFSRNYNTLFSTTIP